MSVGSEHLGHGGGFAFSIYRIHSAWLRSVLSARWGVRDVDDLVQETWLRLALYAAEREIRHPKALLLRIAANLAADRFRREGRGERYALETAALSEGGCEAASQEESVLARQLIL